MKTILLFVSFVLLFAPEKLWSQWECITPDTSAVSSLDSLISYRSNFHPTSFDDVTLRVYFHVIRHTDSTGGYTYEEVQGTFNFLQSDFNDHGIFFAWDCQVNYIDNSYFIDAYGRFQSYKDSIFNQVNNLDGIDIFLVPDNQFKGGYANGYATESQLVVLGEYPSDPPLMMGMTKVISHEMGHVFFLYHTHRGCESGGIWESITRDSSGNCEWAGDMLCDTPADPNMALNVDITTCEWTGDAHTICEAQAPEPIADYKPDPTNIMAATRIECMGPFTAGQAQRMHEYILELDVLQQCIVNGPFVYENYNCIPPPVFNPSVQGICMELIGDLHDFHIGNFPIGFRLLIGNEIDPNSPTFSEVDPIITESGIYYGFYFNDSTGTYGPPSPILINSCCEFDNDIILIDSVVYNNCPEIFIDLSNYFTGNPPQGAILLWSTSTDPNSEPFTTIGPIVSNPQDTTYYAYYYHEELKCYSEPSIGIKVIIESCCNNTDNVYISDNVNYENPMSIGGNIFVRNQGTLTITSFLEMGAEKGIFVEEGGKLIIEGPDAVLTVCDPDSSYWNGITLVPGSELKTRGGKLLNVKNGIDAQANWLSVNQIIIDIKGIEIHGKSLPSTSGINLQRVSPTNLSGLKVQGFTKGLNSWRPWKRGDILWITNSEFLNLGSVGIYSAYNYFIILNCTFENATVGILSHFSDFGTIDHSEFNNLKTGVAIRSGHNMNISNSKMNLKSVPGSSGVTMLHSPYSYISHNNEILTSRFGISLFNSPYAGIRNNIVTKEDVTSPSPTGGAISLVHSSHSFITNNTINAERARFGIESNNSHWTNIVGNNMQQKICQWGINMSGSMGATIASNSLVNSQFSQEGIYLQNSAGNEINCNSVEDFKFGLNVGHNSEYQDILGNVLDNIEDLTIRSEIGFQPYHGNLFKGGVARALGLTLDQINDSRFLVNSDHDYHLPTDPDPGDDQWFRDEDESDFYVCPDSTNIPEELIPFNNDSLDLCLYYQQLKTLDTLKPNKFFLGVYDLWFLSESRQEFTLPTCILSDPDFQNLCGMQEMVAVAMDLEQLGQHELATDSLKSYQQQWVETTDSVVQSQLINLIAAELDSLASDFQDARLQDSLLLSSIESDLNSINCSSTLMSTWKGIYQKYLSFLHAGEVDSADYSTLRQYSSLCSDIYGKPIHLARAVTATFDTTYYAQYDNCLPGMEQRIILEQTPERKIKIWPNPTRGVVQFELPDSYTGELTITDITGRTLKTYRIDKADIEFVELPYINGMYLLNFISDGGQMEQHKIMIIK